MEESKSIIRGFSMMTKFSLDLPICKACGSQYDAIKGEHPKHSENTLQDPRQFVPPSGQQWTNLRSVRESHKNKWKQDAVNPKIWSIWTEPKVRNNECFGSDYVPDHTSLKFAIGQRAILVENTNGNVLWDLITLLDDSTIEFIKSRGGLKAIVISHPHFYTTYIEWAQTFDCPVYLSTEDKEWLCRGLPTDVNTIFIGGTVKATEILPGVTAITAGGHFPGSLVLHWDDHLFIADTIMTVPVSQLLAFFAFNIRLIRTQSAYTPHPRPPGQTSYTFQWSIPNMIPLGPDDIWSIWQAMKPYDFHTTFGGFNGMTVRDQNIKGRILDSMKIQVRSEGWKEHQIFDEQVM
ncbi:MAG: hypothetical protein Q9222_002078 [Ikaeria aurantiellina]